MKLIPLLLCLSYSSFAQDIPLPPSLMVVDAGVVDVPMEPAPVTVSAEDFELVVTTAKAIYGAVKSKEWGKLVFLVITFLVIFTRKFLAPRVAFFRGKGGPPLLAFLWAGAGALATTWPAGKQLTLADGFLVLQAGIMAAGGWTLLKNALEAFSPKDETQENWATTVLGWFTPREPKPFVPPAVPPVA